MNIFILPSAMADLADGFDFYEKQETGLGDYFLNSLLADIDSLKLYAAFIGRYLDFTEHSRNDFPSRFITKPGRKDFLSAPFLIATAIQGGFGNS